MLEEKYFEHFGKRLAGGVVLDDGQGLGCVQRGRLQVDIRRQLGEKILGLVLGLVLVLPVSWTP